MIVEELCDKCGGRIIVSELIWNKPRFVKECLECKRIIERADSKTKVFI